MPRPRLRQDSSVWSMARAEVDLQGWCREFGLAVPNVPGSSGERCGGGVPVAMSMGVVVLGAEGFAVLVHTLWCSRWWGRTFPDEPGWPPRGHMHHGHAPWACTVGMQCSPVLIKCIPAGQTSAVADGAPPGRVLSIVHLGGLVQTRRSTPRLPRNPGTCPMPHVDRHRLQKSLLHRPSPEYGARPATELHREPRARGAEATHTGERATTTRRHGNSSWQHRHPATVNHCTR